MKMAKASQADLDMALELANALEAISDRWRPVMPEKIAVLEGGAETEEFNGYGDDCERVCSYLVKLARSASLFRVVMGMVVLLDPANKVVDPNANTLEHHPDRVIPPAPAVPPCDQFDKLVAELDATDPEGMAKAREWAAKVLKDAAPAVPPGWPTAGPICCWCCASPNWPIGSGGIEHATDGWRWVPVEPTPEMIAAMAKAWQSAVERDDPNECVAEYRAALAAAPTYQASRREGANDR